MAELTKKLHFKKNTTEHLAKAYSTTAEAGAEYITNKIDGVTAYAPIGATNDSRATIGRVKKSGGTEKAILTMGKPPYTEKSWTTAGTYTFTVPQGVTRIRVAVCGGGSGSLSWNFKNGPINISDGGQSSFGDLITATGAKAPKINARYDDGREFWDLIEAIASVGGTPNGRNGTVMSHATEAAKGADGHALSFANNVGLYGAGGSYEGGFEFLWDTHYLSGGSGGYNSGYVSVTPTATYSIKVGSGSNGYDHKGKNQAKAGNSGFVLIAYGGDI